MAVDTAAEVERSVVRCCIGFGDLKVDHVRCFSLAAGKSQRSDEDFEM